MPDAHAIIGAFMESLSEAMAEPFDLIDEVEPGVKMPAEALSRSHGAGVYCEKLPLKVRENLAGFRRIALGELRPQVDGRAVRYLECVALRGARFRAEQLQYIEDGFEAMVDEVKYPAGAVMGAIYAMQRAYGETYLYLNESLPMPLLVTSQPPDEADGTRAQVLVQGFSGEGFIPTNIHVEVGMEYARRWVPGVHTYYKKI